MNYFLDEKEKGKGKKTSLDSKRIEYLTDLASVKLPYTSCGKRRYETKRQGRKQKQRKKRKEKQTC